MSYYCPNCGAEVVDSANYCPQCGSNLNGGGKTSSSGSDTLKTAATVGGVLLGASALNNLAHRLTHRRRPMYRGPVGGPPPRRDYGPDGPGGRGHGGPGGPGGPGHGGPGGPGRGGRW